MFSYAGACVAQQQRKHVLRNSSTDIPVTSRGNMTKHVLDVLPFKSTTWYQRVRAIICWGLACVSARADVYGKRWWARSLMSRKDVQVTLYGWGKRPVNIKQCRPNRTLQCKARRVNAWDCPRCRTCCAAGAVVGAEPGAGVPSLVGAAWPGRRKLPQELVSSVLLSVLGALSVLLGCDRTNTSCCRVVAGCVWEAWVFICYFCIASGSLCPENAPAT